jgi:hypothetical protein
MKRYLILLSLLSLAASAFGQTGKAKRSDGSECTAFPCIVATVSLTNQSQALTSTPIFTPVANGIFRLSAYLSAAANSHQGDYVSVFVGWTDELGAKKGVAVANQGSSNAQYATFVVQDIGGQPLLYQTKPIEGGMTYNLLITVEQLQ